MRLLAITLALAIVGSAVADDNAPPDGTTVKRTTYEDGSPQREVTMQDGVKHGVEIWWSRNGMRTETTFEHGVEHGPFRSFWKNGNKEQEGQYEHGLRTGTWHDYDSKGELLFTKSYLFGELHGTKTQFGSGSGPQKGRRVVVRETEYLLGLPHGKEVVYWNNGNVSARGTNVLGKREGVWETFASDGRALPTRTYVCGKESTRIETPGAPGTATCRHSAISISRPKRARGARTIGKAKDDVAVKLQFDKTICELVKQLADVEVRVGGSRLKCAHFRIRTKTAAPGGVRG
jgi:antitoxin component YwqK of YwqJK toxin-antitoxin module